MPPLPLPFALLWGFTLPAPRPGLLWAPGALPGPSRARCTSSSHRRRAPIRSRRRRTSTSRRCGKPSRPCCMRHAPRGAAPSRGTPREGCRSVSTWRASPRVFGSARRRRRHGWSGRASPRPGRCHPPCPSNSHPRWQRTRDILRWRRRRAAGPGPL